MEIKGSELASWCLEFGVKFLFRRLLGTLSTAKTKSGRFLSLLRVPANSLRSPQCFNTMELQETSKGLSCLSFCFPTSKKRAKSRFFFVIFSATGTRELPFPRLESSSPDKRPQGTLKINGQNKLFHQIRNKCLIININPKKSMTNIKISKWLITFCILPTL